MGQAESVVSVVPGDVIRVRPGAVGSSGWPWSLNAGLIGESTQLDVVGDLKSIFESISDIAKEPTHSEECSIFTSPSSPPAALTAARNAVKWLKVLRYPAILRFLHCDDQPTVPGSSTPAATPKTIQLCTEPCIPLVDSLASLSDDEILVGLYRILTTLCFLHSTCQISHNNLSVDAIYLSPLDAGWRLGGFEFAAKIDQCSTEYFKGIESMISERAKTPEGSVGLTAGIHVRDAYAFANLVEDILASREDEEDTLGLANFAAHVRRTCGDKTANRRQPLSTLNEMSLFEESKLLQALKTLGSISTRASHERAQFFAQLIQDIKDIAPGAVAQLLLPQLFTNRVLSDPSAEPLLRQLLVPKENGNEGLLDMDLFLSNLIPIVVNEFYVHDRRVRLTLLRHLHLFAPYIPHSTLKDSVIPNIIAGLSDTSDGLVQATLVALANITALLKGAPLFPYLGTRTAKFRLTVPRGEIYHEDSLPVVAIVSSAEESVPSSANGSGSPVKTPRLKADKPLSLSSTPIQRNGSNASRTGQQHARPYQDGEVVDSVYTHYDGSSVETGSAVIDDRIQEVVHQQHIQSSDFDDWGNDEDSAAVVIPARSAPEIVQTPEEREVERETKRLERLQKQEERKRKMNEKRQSRGAKLGLIHHGATRDHDESANTSAVQAREQNEDDDDEFARQLELERQEEEKHRLAAQEAERAAAELEKSKQLVAAAAAVAKKSSKANRANAGSVGADDFLAGVEIEVQVKKVEEPDFFADMTPSFKNSTSALSSGSNRTSAVQVAAASPVRENSGSEAVTARSVAASMDHLSTSLQASAEPEEDGASAWDDDWE